MYKTETQWCRECIAYARMPLAWMGKTEELRRFWNHLDSLEDPFAGTLERWAFVKVCDQKVKRRQWDLEKARWWNEKGWKRYIHVKFPSDWSIESAQPMNFSWKMLPDILQKKTWTPLLTRASEIKSPPLRRQIESDSACANSDMTIDSHRLVFEPSISFRLFCMSDKHNHVVKSLLLCPQTSSLASQLWHLCQWHVQNSRCRTSGVPAHNAPGPGTKESKVVSEQQPMYSCI